MSQDEDRIVLISVDKPEVDLEIFIQHRADGTDHVMLEATKYFDDDCGRSDWHDVKIELTNERIQQLQAALAEAWVRMNTRVVQLTPPDQLVGFMADQLDEQPDSTGDEFGQFNRT